MHGKVVLCCLHYYLIHFLPPQLFWEIKEHKICPFIIIFSCYVVDFKFYWYILVPFCHVYVLNTSFLSETWGNHCSSRWGLVCRYFKSLTYSDFSFSWYNCQNWPQNSLAVALTSRVALLPVCSQDQHMRPSLKSYIRLLKIISDSASQSCLGLILLFATMLVMYVWKLDLQDNY